MTNKNINTKSAMKKISGVTTFTGLLLAASPLLYASAATTGVSTEGAESTAISVEQTGDIQRIISEYLIIEHQADTSELRVGRASEWNINISLNPESFEGEDVNIASDLAEIRTYLSYNSDFSAEINVESGDSINSVSVDPDVSLVDSTSNVGEYELEYPNDLDINLSLIPNSDLEEEQEIDLMFSVLANGEWVEIVPPEEPEPTPEPTPEPSPSLTIIPTEIPSESVEPTPIETDTSEPTPVPSPGSPEPSLDPDEPSETPDPTVEPEPEPTSTDEASPSPSPVETDDETTEPTSEPSETVDPTNVPTDDQTVDPIDNETPVVDESPAPTVSEDPIIRDDVSEDTNDEYLDEVPLNNDTVNRNNDTGGTFTQGRDNNGNPVLVESGFADRISNPVSMLLLGTGLLILLTGVIMRFRLKEETER